MEGYHQPITPHPALPARQRRGAGAVGIGLSAFRFLLLQLLWRRRCLILPAACREKAAEEECEQRQNQ